MAYKLLIKRGDNALEKAISDSRPRLFTLIEMANPSNPEYTPTYKLEEEECYKLSTFSDHPFFPDFLSPDVTFASGQYRQWNKDTSGLEFFLNTDGRLFFFQKFSRSQIYENSWMSLSGEMTPKLKDEKILILAPYAHAVYEKETDTLFFKKLDDLKKIFPGIEELYRKATQQEIDGFLSNSFLNISGYQKAKMGVMNRKRIALTLGHQIPDTPQKRKQFCETLKNYCPDMHIKGQKIEIKTESDLKHVLYHLDERFYTTDRTRKKRMANSVLDLS